MGRLDDKITLATGALGGIGLALVSALQAEGAAVWSTDIRDEEGAALVLDGGLLAGSAATPSMPEDT